MWNIQSFGQVLYLGVVHIALQRGQLNSLKKCDFSFDSSEKITTVRQTRLKNSGQINISLYMDWFDDKQNNLAKH